MEKDDSHYQDARQAASNAGYHHAAAHPGPLIVQGIRAPLAQSGSYTTAGIFCPLPL